MMKCDIITLFPEMIAPTLQTSILKRALERGLLEIRLHQLRDFTSDKHHVTDDAPYGGGPGMVLKPEPIFAAVERIQSRRGEVRVLLTSPQGRVFDQEMAEAFSREERALVFICGHYEGVDERVRAGIGLEEVSIGDYILTGGELATLVIIDASARLIPGVLGAGASIEEESFSSPFLEYPHYTRPAEFKGMKVPEVLTSGNHQAIRDWRKRQALLNTLHKRPDLLTDVSAAEGEGPRQFEHKE